MSKQEKHWTEALAEEEEEGGPLAAAVRFLSDAEEQFTADHAGGWPAVVDAVPGFVLVASADEDGKPDLAIYTEEAAVQWYRDAVAFHQDAGAECDADDEPPDISECMHETAPSARHEEDVDEARD